MGKKTKTTRKALDATSGALSAASAASAVLGQPELAVPLAAASGVSKGVSKILKAFGGSLPEREVKRLGRIKMKAEKDTPVSENEMKFISRVVKREAGKMKKKDMVPTMDLSDLVEYVGEVAEESKPTPKPKTKRKAKAGAGLPTIKVKRIGTKREVWNGKAQQTSGGLRKTDLIKNKRGSIVSKKKSELGKKLYAERGLIPKTAEEMAAIRKKRSTKG